MTDNSNKRLSQIARELNVGLTHLADFLVKKGFEVNPSPNEKVTHECYQLLLQQFSSDKYVKEKSEELIRKKAAIIKETVTESEDNQIKSDTEKIIEKEEKISQPEIIIAIKKVEEKKIEEKEEIEVSQKSTLKILGKIDLEPQKGKSKKEKAEKIEISDKKTETIIEKTIPVTEKIETKKPEIISEKPVEEIKKTDTVREIDSKEKNNNTEINITNLNETTAPENDIKVIGRIDLDALNQRTRPDRKVNRAERRKGRREKELAGLQAIEIEKAKQKEVNNAIEAKKLKDEKPKEEKSKIIPGENFIETKVQKLTGPKLIGRIDLPAEKSTDKTAQKPAENAADKNKRKRKRHKRVKKPLTPEEISAAKVKTTVKPKKIEKAEVNDDDVKNQVRETLAKLTDKRKKSTVKHRKVKRDEKREKIQVELDRAEQNLKILKITEFISANELATLMDISVNKVISTCFELGKMVTINSRMDAELISIVAEENGFQVEFIDINENDFVDEYVDKPEELITRPPIVTVMGHVDHGKTSLLDFIRHANVIAGEAGGITQHIGAYKVQLETGENITFLDTPGHEAFTAMRARGAKVTDIVIIIVAADDNIMPQTEEAIAHAKAAEVPIIFAINKIDKDGANPEKIKESLAARNFLVEDWGGKFQSKDISAKSGLNVNLLLEEIVLAAEMLDLKANPNRPAKGTIIEASLDKGRGYLTTILVQTGTLKVGDIVLCGAHSGKVKAMYNERNQKVDKVSPSEPVVILGLDGAPQAGDTFHVMSSEKEAKDIANKNKRLQREQTLRAHKHITLDEIGRRLKLGNFQQLNVIIKGDVIGSIEAIADSFIKLGNEEIIVNVIHKAVGQISEADVMLAAASNAIIVGFQVRPALAAKRLAEKEEIEIRLYSVIYDAIEELKSAMEGMLSPEIREEINATIEIREVFKITKVGKIAGCMVLDGKIQRDNKIRIIRDGIIIHTGKLGSLKRYKDEVKEVVSGQECGLNIENYQNIEVGDLVEAFTEKEFAKKL